MHAKLLTLCGVAFVAAIVATLLVGGGSLETDASSAEIARHYDEKAVQHFIISFLFAATVPFLIGFAIALAWSAPSAWGQMTIAGAILAGSAILATAAIHFALLDAAERGGAIDALPALHALDQSTWIAFNAGFGVMMLGAAGALRGDRPWLGWTALVLGVALFVPYVDFVALILMLVWIAVTSVVLARGSASTALEGAAEPA